MRGACAHWAEPSSVTYADSSLPTVPCPQLPSQDKDVCWRGSTRHARRPWVGAVPGAVGVRGDPVRSVRGRCRCRHRKPRCGAGRQAAAAAAGRAARRASLAGAFQTEPVSLMDERSSLRFFNTYALSTKVMQDVVTKPVPRKVLGHPFPCDSVTVLATASHVFERDFVKREERGGNRGSSLTRGRWQRSRGHRGDTGRPRDGDGGARRGREARQNLGAGKWRDSHHLCQVSESGGKRVEVLPRAQRRSRRRPLDPRGRSHQNRAAVNVSFREESRAASLTL